MQTIRCGRNVSRLVAVLIVILMTTVTIADDDYGNARELVDSGAILSLGAILEKHSNAIQGRILEVEFEREDGRYLYEIEILDELGIVRELEVDAVTGELLKNERED